MPNREAFSLRNFFQKLVLCQDFSVLLELVIHLLLDNLSHDKVSAL